MTSTENLNFRYVYIEPKEIYETVTYDSYTCMGDF